METLRKILEQADHDAVAVGHFNISDLVTLKAVFDAARDLRVPVIVGVSEGERQFIGTRQAAAVVKSLREEYDFPIFLNADHTHSLPSALEAAKAGYDWVVFDVSTLPFEENVRQTKAAVEALKGLCPDILVEGEIGDIGSGSEVHERTPDLKKGLTTPAEAKQFVHETHVDTLAPAVGNMHGMLKSMIAGETSKRLDIERIRAIKAATQIFMTLHGASGTGLQEPTMMTCGKRSTRESPSFTSTPKCGLPGGGDLTLLSRKSRVKLFRTNSCHRWLRRSSTLWLPD